MTANIVVGILLGHLVGDYLLQNNWVTTPPAKAGGFWLQKDSQRSVQAQEC